MFNFRCNARSIDVIGESKGGLVETDRAEFELGPVHHAAQVQVGFVRFAEKNVFAKTQQNSTLQLRLQKYIQTQRLVFNRLLVLAFIRRDFLATDRIYCRHVERDEFSKTVDFSRFRNSRLDLPAGLCFDFPP